ncbi:MAG: tRNA epoxyqueuosine(34) reductase QueG [Eubacteriaceae bacterium]|nr:tRNA epoxyqueuosine(34) reductase QueG [Eubacteriaceae bacterium]
MRSPQSKPGADELLRVLAPRCGIDLAGVCDTNLFSSLGTEVTGSYGDAPLAFSKGDIRERFDINGEWEDGKGIISFAVSYAPSDTEKKAPGSVRVCKASWGEDYHDVLGRKGEELMKLFSEVYPCSWRVYVDTGKLSDRACAYCAGIGFYGKNGFIISPEYGSFIFLGHILTDIPLEKRTVPLECLCGECDRCLWICPRGALGKKKWVDYENCVSYLTQKGRAYEETDYIYGCDLCQNVSPFNEKAPKDLHEEFSFPGGLRYPDPKALINMDDDEFKKLYGRSALAWRGASTIRKNARRYLKRKDKSD